MAINCILEILTKKKKTQGWLAQASGLTRPYINRIVKGKIDPKITTCNKIAQALKVSLGDLWPIEGGK